MNHGISLREETTQYLPSIYIHKKDENREPLSILPIGNLKLNSHLLTFPWMKIMGKSNQGNKLAYSLLSTLILKTQTTYPIPVTQERIDMTLKEMNNWTLNHWN